MEIKDLEKQMEMKIASVRDFNSSILNDIQELHRQTVELLTETSEKNWGSYRNGEIDLKKEFENVKISQRARMCDLNLKKIERYILNFEI